MNNSIAFRHLTLLAPVMLLGCSDPKVVEPETEPDPIEEQALNERLLTDPDLVNPAALRTGDAKAVPAIGNNSKLIAAAQDEAADMIGGRSALLALPEPDGFSRPLLGELFQDAEALAEYVGVTRECIERLEVSAIWAARLPDMLDIYPRGATMYAAGADEPDCNVRVVRYRTPVPQDEVLRWYFTRARKAGQQMTHKTNGTVYELASPDPQSPYRIIARSLPSGLSEIVLVALSR